MGGEEKGRGRKKRQGCGSSGDWELLLRLLVVEEARRRCEAGAPATGRKTREVVGSRGVKGEGSERDGGWLGAETKGESGGGVGIWWRLDRLGLGLDCYLYQMNLG